MTTAGLRSLEWLSSVQASDDGYFAPIGSNGFYERGGPKAMYDQQPVEAGAMVSTPTCGACFGGSGGVLAPGENAITTTNRNFKGRMGSSEAGVHLANAWVAAAAAVAGEIIDPAELAGAA